jgi:hypothetical protein
MATPTCNLNCVCIDSDCSYKHYITYKERKIVKGFYDAISNKSKDEPNPDMRKKNCTFGQLCDKEMCGFRHRLSFSNREKLIVSFRFNKICPNAPTKKTIGENAYKNDMPKPRNLFMTLENDEVEVEENISIPTPTPSTTTYKPTGKSWVDVVLDVPVEVKVNLSVETSRWEDLDDDEFYMKF